MFRHRLLPLQQFLWTLPKRSLPDHLEASTVHPRRTEIANADVATPTPFTLAPNNQWKILFLLIGWKLSNFMHFNCSGMLLSHSQNVVISKKIIIRQKPLNCLCEGLLLFCFQLIGSNNNFKFKLLFKKSVCAVVN